MSVKDDFITKIIQKELHNRKNKDENKGLLIFNTIKKVRVLAFII